MSNSITQQTFMATDWIDFTPSLTGATDDPVATYSKQLGQFIIVNRMLHYRIYLITTTMTKTTTSDALRITLPIAAAGAATIIHVGSGRVENGTAVANGTQPYVTSGNSYLNVRYIPGTSASADMTYAATAPGIGVLTNTITFIACGSYAF